MIITISGNAGSGKSSIAKFLEKNLPELTGKKWKRIYVGGIRREIARDKGMNIHELNAYAQEHPETDVDVDQKVAKEARRLHQEGYQLVVEGRTQFHFLKESLKIFIKVDPEEGAKRIWKDLSDQESNKKRNEGDLPKTIEDLKKDLQSRDKNDTDRYLKYYGFDYRSESHYDKVIDTTRLNEEEAKKVVLGYILEVIKNDNN